MIIDNPMKNSPLTITLYDRAPLTKERNGIIDNLNTLLASHTAWRIKTETSTNPFELSMRQFKLNASDSNAFITTANIQYMRISWGNRYHAFYWVNKITRGSNDVILLDIELDVLNTIHNGDDQATSPLLSFSPLSSIEREHCNRFKGAALSVGANERSTIIDAVAENSNVRLYHQAEEQNRDVDPRASDVHASELDSCVWYLIYAASHKGEGAYICCYLVPEYNDDVIYVDSGASSQPIQPLADMTLINRDSPLISKIIRCPYCPIDPTNINGSLWTFDKRFTPIKTPTGTIFNDSIAPYTNTLQINLTVYGNQLENLRPFTRHIDDYLNTDFYLGETINFSSDIESLGETRHIIDPKLHNSEFMGIYFVYDSSVWQFKPELYNAVSNTHIVTNITYYQSSSVDSSLAFQISFSPLGYMSEDNYPCLITSNRQAEIPVFTDDYMNYIKNGYNYDRQKQTLNNFLSIGSSAVGLGVSLASGNPLALVGSALSLGSSITKSITGEIDFQKNLKTMAQQSFNVSGINDSSLFEAYGDSRLRCIVMTPRAEEIKRFDDIFYYYGYNRAGVQGIPNVTTRAWFNFLKGEIILNDANKIPVWLYEKVKDAFRSGVTYFHCHQISLFPSLYQWNLEQTRENYETFLLNL